MVNVCNLIWNNFEVVFILTKYNIKTVERGFGPLSGQTKDYKIGICCFSAEHASLRRKRKDLLARNQDNMSAWGDVSVDCYFSELAQLKK